MPAKAPGKKAAAAKKRKAASAKKSATAKKSPVKKAAAKKAPAKKAPAKKAAAKKAPVKKAAGKKAPAKKAAAKKTPVKKAAVKKAAGKKAPVKKAAAKKAPAKKAAARKTAAKAPARKPAAGRARAPARARGITATTEFKNFEPYKARRGEDYMSDDQMAHFKAILLKWKSELMQEVDRTVMHMKDEAANFPDPADRATQEEEFSLELRTRDRERKLIKKIDSTIERLEQDDYGFCDACGIEIGVKRLEARPTATLCIDCKTLAEIKERQEMG